MVSLTVGVIALAVAAMLSSAIGKADAGNDRMKEISGYIHEGAMAFLYREYKYLSVFIVVVAIIIAMFLSPLTAICFVGGAASDSVFPEIGAGSENHLYRPCRYGYQRRR